ncbi:MAG TPA: phytanoyl-CoA dioxygenase family protein [Pyrinomonadaceae bacterium]|jgi:hypothetical protein
MSISVRDALDRDFLKNVERDGYAIIPNLIDVKSINSILSGLDQITADQAISRRAGGAFGIRNLLNVLPSARTFAESSTLLSLVEPVLGPGARVVRGVYFDKHRDANWKVAWHQDLTIAVRERVEADGFGPWSLKAGINHVQPPAEILEGILALRIHLDDTDETNGALRVLPGSHKYGRLSTQDIQTLKSKSQVVTCIVPAGGVMLMRPLLLHASSAATHPRHRRVLHFEYSALSLPGGMTWYDAPL